MKALVLKSYNHFAYEDVPEPRIANNTVLVRVKACGICGSDVHGMDGSSGRRKPPIVMGHEASGIIEETGPHVTEWKKGQRVTFDSTIYCQNCHFCRNGQINLCDNRRVLGVSCDDYHQEGAFAEYVAVPKHILYPLPEKVSFEQAAMIEPLSIAFHAVNRTPILLDDIAVVVGAGVIGLLTIQSLRAAGCGKIIVIDIQPERLIIARNIGADITLNPLDNNIADTISEQTSKRGVDIAIEAAGIEATTLLAIESLKKGGTLTAIGNISPTVKIPLQRIVTREISINSSCASNGEYPSCIAMIANRTIDVDSLISAKVPLSEGASWFKKLYNRQSDLIKVIIVP